MSSSLKNIADCYGSSSDDDGDLDDRTCRGMKRKNYDELIDTETNAKSVKHDHKTQSNGGVNEDAMAKERLPVPLEVREMFGESSEQMDNSSLHQGRSRSFPHDPGSWATLIYIPIASSCEESLRTLLDRFLIITGPSIDLLPVNDFHISISRTVSLRHHWIEPLVHSFKSKVKSTNRFNVSFTTVDLYANDEGTRTFVGIRLNSGTEHLRKLVAAADECLAEFRLPQFHKIPSFHMSIGWCLGCKIEQLLHYLPDMQIQLETFFQHWPNLRGMMVNQVNIKTGNKSFSIHF